MTVLTDLGSALHYDHIVVAPHLDDAALSCGGNLARLVAESRRVLVVTLCAGSPPVREPSTDYVAYLHAAWNLGDDPIALRRQEDLRALALLGADALHLGELDAVYRDPAYGTRDGIFGELVAGDPLIGVAATTLGSLRRQNPQAQLYLPLAVGGHVDHLAVWAARGVVAGLDCRFYEDFPYAARADAFARRMAVINEPLAPTTVRIDDYLACKIDAIAEYRSQQSELFDDRPMREVVEWYAMTIGDQGHACERLWSQLS